MAWLPFLALVLAGGVSGDAAPVPKDEAAAIRFLRILTPENRINDWPLGEGKYLPLDAAEFERLAAIGESHTSKTPAVAAISARYEARLADDQLIGEAAMDVILAGSEPALLSFEPCNLAIRSTNWTGTPSQQSGTAGGVALGLGSDGKRQLMVDHSGRLSFEWSLDGRRDPGDIVSFSLEIPTRRPTSCSSNCPEGSLP